MRILGVILEWLFPRRCLGCKLPHTFLCEGCLKGITMNHEPRVACPEIPTLDGLFVVAPYMQKSVLQTCIKTMKYGAARDLARILGDFLARSVEGLGNAVLVPVPLHKKRLSKRGYNQALLLAEQVARHHELPIWNGIVRMRDTFPQAQLSREERLKNLLNSFSLKENLRIPNKKIILVDDVCSTGATLNECAKVLRQHGATEIRGLVLARG